MPTQRITVTLLVASLVVNVILAVFMAVDSANTRHLVDTALLEMTEQSCRMQHEILNDLESKDETRIAALRAKLRAGVAVQGYKSYLIRTSPKDNTARARR